MVPPTVLCAATGLTVRNRLKLHDFECRAFVVQTGWQSPAESYLIDLFKPVWNSEIGICFGFGKHGGDPKTRPNLRSPWYTLHPGRDWAHRDSRMMDARSVERIPSDISDHLDRYAPLKSTDKTLRHFLNEMRMA